MEPKEAVPRARGSHTADPFSAPSLWRRQHVELPPSPSRSARTPSMPSKASAEPLYTRDAELGVDAAAAAPAKNLRGMPVDCLAGSSARSAYLRFLEDEIIAQRAFLRMHRSVRQGQATPRRRGLFSRGADDSGAAAFGVRRHQRRVAWEAHLAGAVGLQPEVAKHMVRPQRSTDVRHKFRTPHLDEPQEQAVDDEDDSDSDEGITFSLAHGCAARRRPPMAAAGGSTTLARNSAARNAGGCRRPGKRGSGCRRDDLRWDTAQAPSPGRNRGPTEFDESTSPGPNDGKQTVDWSWSLGSGNSPEADNGALIAGSATVTGSHVQEAHSLGAAGRQAHFTREAEPFSSAGGVVTGPFLYNAAVEPPELESRELGEPLPWSATGLERGTGAFSAVAELDRAARLAAGLDEVREFSCRTPAVPSALLRDVTVVQTGPDLGDDPYKVSTTSCKQTHMATDRKSVV